MQKSSAPVLATATEIAEWSLEGVFDRLEYRFARRGFHAAAGDREKQYHLLGGGQ